MTWYIVILPNIVILIIIAIIAKVIKDALESIKRQEQKNDERFSKLFLKESLLFHEIEILSIDGNIQEFDENTRIWYLDMRNAHFIALNQTIPSSRISVLYRIPNQQILDDLSDSGWMIDESHYFMSGKIERLHSSSSKQTLHKADPELIPTILFAAEIYKEKISQNFVY